MNPSPTPPTTPSETQGIDWRDWRFGAAVGIVAVLEKLVRFNLPEWTHGLNNGLIASLMVAAYILHRARREPEKLDVWGITTPLSSAALVMAVVLLAVAVGTQAAAGLALVGTLSFESRYVPDMIEYLLGAFPQQFFLCSVGLVSLGKLAVFRGSWRLPLTVAVLFSLAHWWPPAQFPGTPIPLQMITTLPAGYFAAWYFLRFRSIVPLVVLHAVIYVISFRWVEAHV
jgi:membrane protease YdiL (CAAX protease family)